jgi:hypothetical protein
MATNYNAPVPWSPNYDNWRALNKKGRKREQLEHSLSSGWRTTLNDEWDKNPKKPKTKKVKIRDRYVEVPDADYEDFLGHLVSPPSDPDSAIGRYIDDANFSQVCAGAGHITSIEYDPNRQLLDVVFGGVNGAGKQSRADEVVFFRVPKEVYYELKYLAESGRTQIGADHKTQRSVLGIRFWDIVRVRGTQHVARYRFEYIAHGAEPAKSDLPPAKTATQPAASSKGKVDEELQYYQDLAKGFSRRLGKHLDEVLKAKTASEAEAILTKYGVIEE